MKKLILLLAVCLTTAVFGQEFVKNSILKYPGTVNHDSLSMENYMRKFNDTIYLQNATDIIDSIYVKNATGVIDTIYVEYTSIKKSLNKVKRKILAQQYFEVDSAYLYAGGMLQSIVTNKNDDNVTPTGSLGFNFETGRITFNFYYSYNARSVFQMDSLYKLGNALLIPNNSGQSLSIGTYCALKNWVGLKFQTSVSDDLWQINDSTQLDTSPLLLRLGFRFTPFNFDLIKSNKIGFYVDACYTHRTILGDFRNGYYQIGDQIINQGGYNGFELTANFVFDNLALFSSYSLNPKDKYLLPGFSGSQVTFGVKLTAKAITLR
ncbi:MAG: hypothetical protein HYZ14_07200 [Bacteroidetes bacterium]|nr:hypothetical protein [Bacteroidota bacterium]